MNGLGGFADFLALRWENARELVFSPKGRPETLTAVGRSLEGSSSNSSKLPTGSAAPGATPAGAGPRPRGFRGRGADKTVPRRLF